MVESSGKQVWVGITDRQTEGVFRYVNGEKVNLVKGQPFLYYFAAGEPNSAGNEDCLHYFPRLGALNDVKCDSVNLEETDFHGLCEIKPMFINV